MAIRRILLTSMVFALRVYALEYWVDYWCQVTETPAGEMIEQAVHTARQVKESLTRGEPKMLEAFKQLSSFAYNAPGAENDQHLATFEGKRDACP